MSIEEESMISATSSAATSAAALAAHRKGRRKTSPSKQKQTSPPSQQQPQSLQSTNNLKNSYDKPREERSYKDFFPDLDIREPLAIIKVPDSSINQTVSKRQSTPVPNSPSIDEYETASEGESSSMTTLHKLPIPSYQKIKPPNQKQKVKKDESSNDSQLFHRPDNHYIRYIGKLIN